MTVLVILHHLAITYGGEGGWYYREAGGDTVTKAILTILTVVDQSFFMGLFFFISGYVTPASFDRKGAGKFVADRLLRFGIPLLAFMLVLDPLLRYVADGYAGTRTFGRYVLEQVAVNPLRGVIGFHVGPLWFLFALLIFNVIYCCYRKWNAVRMRRSPLVLSGRLIAIYLVVVSMANFLIRLALPVGEDVLSLQLAYFPSYVGLFYGGIASYRGGWLERLSPAVARRWLAAVLVLIPVLPVVMALGGALSGNADAFKGGWSWQSAFYSAADPVLGFGISYVLLVRFRDRHSAETRLSAGLTGSAFLTYVIHAVIVTYVAYSLRDIQLYPLLKFALIGCIVVPLCFAIAALLRRVPLIRRWF